MTPSTSAHRTGGQGRVIGAKQKCARREKTGEKQSCGEQALQEASTSDTGGSWAGYRQGSWTGMEQQHLEFRKVLDPVLGDAPVDTDLTKPAQSSHGLCQQQGSDNVHQGWKDAYSLPAPMGWVAPEVMCFTCSEDHSRRNTTAGSMMLPGELGHLGHWRSPTQNAEQCWHTLGMQRSCQLPSPPAASVWRTHCPPRPGIRTSL